MQEIDIRPASLDRLGTLLSPERADRMAATASHARSLLAGRTVWNINATAHGGGVAEMLQGLVAYGLGAGVDTRWLVLDGPPAFFAITKRIHNALHGAGDAAIELGAAEHDLYSGVLQANLIDLRGRIRAGDIVVLHDPQTAGLVAGVRAVGAHVVWRSHIGRDETNPRTDQGWAFLRGYLQLADAYVFSRQAYVPDWIDPMASRVIAPSIDPFSAKNRELSGVEVHQVLTRAGLIAGDGAESVPFVRRDGTIGHLRSHANRLAGAEPPPAGVPLVVQVSRWDRLKDMLGVLSAFAEGKARSAPDAHLMLVGPDTSGVSDDPEGAEVLALCRAAWGRLPDPVRSRCSLACIPMDDVDENAIIINALQRHAAVVVQKSLAEGFGLTVAEALWKSRPVVASAIGGIQDQIVDGRDGLLLPDPGDLSAFAQLLLVLLDDPVRARFLGQNGHRRVRSDFLADRHLTQYFELFEDLLERQPLRV